MCKSKEDRSLDHSWKSQGDFCLISLQAAERLGVRPSLLRMVFDIVTLEVWTKGLVTHSTIIRKSDSLKES